MTSNGVEVEGLGSLSLEASYRNIVQSNVEAAFGVEDVDRAGLRVSVSLDTSDILKAAALLGSVPGNTTFWAKESGTATWKKFTVASIVWTGFNLTFSKTADARLRMDGVLRFANGQTLLAGAVTVLEGQSEPGGLDAFASPNRYFRPINASFTPVGGSALAVLHAESISLAANANVIEDFADDDIGHSAVDVAGWNPLTATLVHKEATKSGTGDISAAQLALAKGVLTSTLLGRGGLANRVLTVNNLLWTGAPVRHGDGYSEYTLQGSASYMKRGTPDVRYDWIGNSGFTPLFTIV